MTNVCITFKYNWLMHGQFVIKLVDYGEQMICVCLLVIPLTVKGKCLMRAAVMPMTQ